LLRSLVRLQAKLRLLLSEPYLLGQLLSLLSLLSLLDLLAGLSGLHETAPLGI
jgi:hypothetical protein